MVRIKKMLSMEGCNMDTADNLMATWKPEIATVMTCQACVCSNSDTSDSEDENEEAAAEVTISSAAFPVPGGDDNDSDSDYIPNNDPYRIINSYVLKQFRSKDVARRSITTYLIKMI